MSMMYVPYCYLQRLNEIQPYWELDNTLIKCRDILHMSTMHVPYCYLQRPNEIQPYRKSRDILHMSTMDVRDVRPLSLPTTAECNSALQVE